MVMMVEMNGEDGEDGWVRMVEMDGDDGDDGW